MDVSEQRECLGLSKAGSAAASASADACAAFCCADAGCSVWQWEPGAGSADGCWVGASSKCSAPGSRPAWVGGRRGSAATVGYGVGTEGGGLKLRSTFGFEACFGERAACADASTTTQWVAATVVASTSTTVTIAAPTPATSNAAATIAAVRYAHMDMPSAFWGTQLAVYNAEGLPATPGVYFASDGRPID